MQTRVDDESAGAPGLIAEHAETGELIRVEPELIGESLGVERPALDEGIGQPAGAHASKGGQIGGFLGERNLQVVPGHTFVEGERRQSVFWPSSWLEGVDIEGRRP